MIYIKLFECPISKSKIEYLVNDEQHTANLNFELYDNTNETCFRAHLALLRTSIDALTKMNIKKILQIVYISEWNELLKDKTTWKATNEDLNNNIVYIECDIDNFLVNYGIGIGLIEW